MRTATLILAAVLSTAALAARGYCAETAPSAGRWPERSESSRVSPPVLVAGDATTPDVVAADRLGNGLPASGSTAEIPAADNPPPDNQPDPVDASPLQDQTSTGDAASNPDSAQDQQPGDQQADDDSQSELPPHVYSLQDFINQGVEDSPLGIELREDCSKLQTHERVCGLAVLDVRNGSPAQKAGIKRYTALTHDLLDGASVAAALVFPPAIVAVAVIDQSGIGESFDLVIGVDGRRVRHILDFEDLTSNIKPGDTIYLTVVRAGKRVQVPVQIPSGTTAFRN
jgi:hypothetical protein